MAGSRGAGLCPVLKDAVKPLLYIKLSNISHVESLLQKILCNKAM